MTYPINTIVTIDFSNGAIFGYPFILDDPKHGVLNSTDSLLAATSDANYIVDVSAQTRQANLRGSYNLIQDQFEVGTATFVINDPDAYFDPQNTSSPYFGKLVPMRKIRMAAEFNGNTYYLFSGYIQSYQYTYPKNYETGFVTLSATDGFRLLNLSNISTVTGAAAGDTTGQRIDKILNTVSWPTSMRSVDTGDTTLQADPGTARQAINAIKNVEFCEQGAFYIDGTGSARFISRANLQKHAAATPIVFANNGTGIPYFDLKFAHDDKLIINSATIQRTGGVAQTYTSQDSVDKYFKHSINMNNLVLANDTQAANIAAAYVATRRETTIRIDEITLDLSTPDYTAGIEAALGADNFTLIKVISDQQAGSQITKTLEIISIAHDITPGTWKTYFVTSEPIIDAFILNSDTYGVLDVSALTY